MRKLNFGIWNDLKGQDILEYVLLAGLVAVTAGAAVPGVANSIHTIIGQVGSVLSAVGAGHGSGGG